jgi:hypothetical protein
MLEVEKKVTLMIGEYTERVQGVQGVGEAQEKN